MRLVKNPEMQENGFNSLVGKIPWRRDRLCIPVFSGFPCGSAGKESAGNAGDLGSIPGLGRSPGEGKGYPLQYSGLENSMVCRVHRVAKSRTGLSDFHRSFTQISIATRGLITTASPSSRLDHHLSSQSASGMSHVCASPRISPPKALCNDPSCHCRTPSRCWPVRLWTPTPGEQVLHRLPFSGHWLSLKASLTGAHFSGSFLPASNYEEGAVAVL